MTPSSDLNPGWTEGEPFFVPAEPGHVRPPRQLPSVRVMAAGLLQAAGGTVMRLARGQSIRRTPDQQAACLAVCEGCPEWLPDKRRCSKCGCFGKFAGYLAAKDCPLGKWPPLTPPVDHASVDP